ncbi:hypothetical protein Q4520_12430 [Alteromonas sp. 1_MG-2023]|uniref:hypothetical protein n=1 Tax=Alteromonas sp. 1_MG-2023 TaxID=3062669 RepID=UPI0026E383C6|nr:hypothetical protein [Alteromonas sp. 1_MG-2023]MDO6476235.1 hypothetical protein [Alteromonas sp. 1_MG-2023]
MAIYRLEEKTMNELNQREINLVGGGEMSLTETAVVGGLSGFGGGMSLGATVGAVGGPPGILIGGLIGGMLGTITGTYSAFVLSM